MPNFKVVLFEHGYATHQPERAVITAAGGELIDATGKDVEEALRLCEEADGILLRRLQFTPALIGRLRRCKIIVRYGVGVDNIDLEAATKAGIIVGHVPIYCLDEVTNQAIGMWLACVRHVVRTHLNMQGGAWDINRNDPVYRTEGRVMGLVGFGNIGQKMARKLAGWDLRLLACDPYVETNQAASLGVQLVDFQTLCRESDFVSLHVPLLTETQHLMRKQAFSLMKPGSILVNTARGPVVDAAALLEALDSGRLACAALDVFEEEPLAVDSPLRKHPKILLSDHVAWYSEESQIQLQKTAAEEIVRVCTGGLPQAIANPEVLKKLKRVDEWKPNSTARWQRKRAEHLEKS